MLLKNGIIGMRVKEERVMAVSGVNRTQQKREVCCGRVLCKV